MRFDLYPRLASKRVGVAHSIAIDPGKTGGPKGRVNFMSAKHHANAHDGNRTTDAGILAGYFKNPADGKEWLASSNAPPTRDPFSRG
ncbi:MAG TPA: hypothetical protein VGL42_04945 [Opitutaceae bacterium]|jgi:hypothetical protein